jgi:hypothetical protein
LVDAQTISLVFGGLSVGVAAIYYVYNMRTTLQTRQAQFFIQFYQNGFGTVEGLKRWIEILHYEFKDNDEFEEKYGSENNPQACAERMQCWSFFDALGLYMKQGLVDRNFVYEYVSVYAIWMWMKFSEVMKRHREIYHSDVGVGLEYLYYELVKMREKDGRPLPSPTFDRYVKQ